MQDGSDRLEAKVQKLQTQLDALEASVETRFQGIVESMSRVEGYVDAMASRCVSIEAHNKLIERVAALERSELHNAEFHSKRYDDAIKRLNDSEASAFESVEQTSIRLLTMEERLDTVVRNQRDFSQRSGASRRMEDRQIDTNRRTIEILEEEIRTVKRQLRDTLSLFSDRRELRKEGLEKSSRMNVFLSPGMMKAGEL